MKILCNRGDIDVYKIDHNYRLLVPMSSTEDVGTI